MKNLIKAYTKHSCTATAEHIFDAWLNEQLIQRWMKNTLIALGLTGNLKTIKVNAHPGGDFTFSDIRNTGETIHWGRYLEIDRPRKLVFSWFTSPEDENEQTSIVTLSFQQKPEACIVHLTHQMDAKFKEYIPQTEHGWTEILKQIDALFK